MADSTAQDISQRSQPEEALPEDRDVIARIMNAIPVGITVFDRRGRITFANRPVQEAARRAGISSPLGCAHNDPAWRLLAEDGSNLPEEAMPFSQVMNSGEAVSACRFASQLPDGQRVYLSSNAMPVLDGCGEIDAVVVTTEDITAQVHAEAQLRESANRNQQLLDALHEGIWEVDQDAHTSFVNPRMAEMLGYRVDEMLGRHLFSFMDETGIQICTRNLERRQQGIREQHDFELLRKDGSRMYVSMETSPIYDQAGRYVGALAGVQDITERVRTEARLRESEEKYRDLVEKVSDVIYATDIKGTVTYVSPAIESCLGYTPEQAVGRPFDEFFMPWDLERVLARVGELLCGRELGPAEYQMVSAAGTPRWVRLSSRPIVEGDKVTGIQGVLTDITERVQAEEERQHHAAAAERERLARDLHDAVSQSLFSVAAIAEALPSVWRRDREEAWRALEELRGLTSGALAEMRSLLLELRPSALLEHDLDALLHQLTEGMTSRTRIPVNVQITGDCSPPSGVRIALYRIAQEALNNVAKHARASRATIDLHCRPGHVRLCITDDGRGFDPEGIRPDGMGIGIMRERALDIGATLSIVSQPGEGARIQVEWQQLQEEGEDA